MHVNPKPDTVSDSMIHIFYPIQFFLPWDWNNEMDSVKKTGPYIEMISGFESLKIWN